MPGRQRDLSAFFLVEEAAQLLVIAYVGVPRVQPGQQGTARWSADGASRIELREPHPLSRHPVEPRRADAALAVRAQLAVPEIVGKDEDDVGRRGGSFRRLPGRRDCHRGGDCDEDE